MTDKNFKEPYFVPANSSEFLANGELRGGDLLARMAPARFLLALVADQLGARQFLFRITNKIKEASNYQLIELSPSKDLAEALSEIDI